MSKFRCNTATKYTIISYRLNKHRLTRQTPPHKHNKAFIYMMSNKGIVSEIIHKMAE